MWNFTFMAYPTSTSIRAAQLAPPTPTCRRARSSARRTHSRQVFRGSPSACPPLPQQPKISHAAPGPNKQPPALPRRAHRTPSRAQRDPPKNTRLCSDLVRPTVARLSPQIAQPRRHMACTKALACSQARAQPRPRTLCMGRQHGRTRRTRRPHRIAGIAVIRRHAVCMPCPPTASTALCAVHKELRMFCSERPQPYSSGRERAFAWRRRFVRPPLSSSGPRRCRILWWEVTRLLRVGFFRLGWASSACPPRDSPTVAGAVPSSGVSRSGARVGCSPGPAARSLRSRSRRSCAWASE